MCARAFRDVADDGDVRRRVLQAEDVGDGDGEDRDAQRPQRPQPKEFPAKRHYKYQVILQCMPLRCRSSGTPRRRTYDCPCCQRQKKKKTPHPETMRATHL